MGASIADSASHFPDSDAELNKKVANHEDSLQQLRTEREGIKQKMGDESDSLAAYERKRSQAQTKHGSLLAQKEVSGIGCSLASQRTAADRPLTPTASLRDPQATPNSRTRARREARHPWLRRSQPQRGRDCRVRAEDGGCHPKADEQDRDDQSERTVRDLGSAAKQRIARQADSRKQEGERQNKIQQLKSDQAADDRARRSTLDQIRAANTRIASLARTIESKTISEADITYQESTLAEDKRHKAELEASIKTADYPAVYRVKGKELKEEEEKREGLHAELGRLNAQANVRARLQLRKSEKTKKDESIDTL